MITAVSSSLEPRHACMNVANRLFDAPKPEEVMGQGPHGFRMFFRIARVLQHVAIRMLS